MAGYIENELAYNAAISARIGANSRKTNLGVWEKIGDHAELIKFIYNNSRNEFYAKLIDGYENYAKMSDKTCDCIRSAIAKKAARIAERAANSMSEHVGAIGERAIYEVVIKFTTSYETEYGRIYVYICEDSAANVIVYKGNLTGRTANVGDTLKGKATVKAHETRDGVKQTILNRPKFEIIPA